MISLDARTIAAIETALSKGDRVEIVPGKNDGVKVVQTHRRVVYTAGSEQPYSKR